MSGQVKNNCSHKVGNGAFGGYEAARYASRRVLLEHIGPDRHLAFVPLSGRLTLLDDAERKRLEGLQQGKAVRLTATQEQEMRENLFLFDSPAEENALLEAAVAGTWQRMQAVQPEAYTVCPTLACNLACSYCFEGDSLTDKPQGVMTDAQVTALFEAIASIREGHERQKQTLEGTDLNVPEPMPPWIGLFGGEPLLPSTRRPVAAILERAQARGFLVGATTNGVNLTRYADLLEKHQAILTAFQVTLDGPKAVHDARRHRLGGQGTFDEIVRGIDLLLSLEIGVNLRVNLDRANLPALPELVAFIQHKGWADSPWLEFSLAPVTVHQEKGCQGQYTQALTELELARQVQTMMEENAAVAEVCHLGFLRHLEHLIGILEPEKLGRGKWGAPRRTGPRFWYCEASTDKQFVFTPEGLIYACTEAVGQPQHAIGRFDPKLDIWRERQGEWVGRTILSHPKCRECAISTLCGGGCNLGARERAGDGEKAGDGAQAGEGTAAHSHLLQIALPGRRLAPPTAFSRPDPFCNAAEDTVRAYLRSAGARLLLG